jgi:hypothetical protein
VSLDVIFAAVVAVLAGLAVVGALVFVLVWEWYAIRRTLTAHRQGAAGGRSHERGVLPPASPAENEQIREGTRRVLAGQPLPGIALDWRGRDGGGRRRP